MAVHVVQVSFIWASWLQKYKILNLGHSLWNTVYCPVNSV